MFNSNRRFVIRSLTSFLILLVSFTASAERNPADLANSLLKESGVAKGICVILGADSAERGLAVARSGDFFVHLLDSDPAAVEAARNAVDVEGLYGKRIVVDRSSFDSLPYADNLIDAVLILHVEDLTLNRYSLPEIFRVLRPGGVVFYGNPKPAKVLTIQAMSAYADRVKYGDRMAIGDGSGLWMMLRKPEPQGVDDWPLWEHGPDNNPVSTDEVIKAPYMTQWLGTPFYNTMPMITTASGGRLFLAMGHIAHHEREEPWLNTLLARNAYNGTILWTMKLPDGYMVHRSAYYASPATFYMIDLDGSGCLMLDPETGEEKGKIEIPGVRGQWKWMSIKDGVLYALVGKTKDPSETTVVRSQIPAWSWGELSQGYYRDRVPWGFGEIVLAYDLEKQSLLWKHAEEKPVDSRAMSLGGGRIFFYGPDSHVGCLNAQTGGLVWTNGNAELRRLIEQKGAGLTSTPGFRSMCFSVYTPVALFFEAQTRMNVVAVSLSDGTYLWHRKKSSYNPNMMYVDGKLIVGVGDEGSTLELHPLSGETIRDLGFKKRSCARLTATPESFFCRGWIEGFTRYDRKTGDVFYNGAFRPSCNDGVLPAFGCLYTGPWPCDCNLTVMGQIALCSAGDFNLSQTKISKDRWERGVGDLNKIIPLETNESDWSTYRGNNARNAASPVALKDGLIRIWELDPERPFEPTVPVSAGDLIFLGGDDGKVRAIDATLGALKWTFRTSGPILQPPSLWNGRAYVGSGDGFIYCLEAQTGRRLWKFRAAPVDRRTMIYNALSSTWPVNSGVLVRDGVVYAAAGIVDYDGTFLYALDAITGDLIWHNSDSGHLDGTLRKGVSAQGTMTAAGERLWMAGGNVISPAIYDLSNGKYLGSQPLDGSPQTNRGEEIGLLGDSIILGGKLRFTTGDNVVDPAKFEALLLDGAGVPKKTVALNKSKIPPAWNDDVFVFVEGRNAAPQCCAMNDLQSAMKDARRGVSPHPKWVAGNLQGCDAVALALADNAALALYGAPRHRSFEIQWMLGLFDPDDGSAKGQHVLSSPPKTGGLLVDRNGRIVVVQQGGRLACFGDADMLRAYTSSTLKQAKDGKGRERFADTMRKALDIVYDPAGRKAVINNLKEMDVRVGEDSLKAGWLPKWEILGPIPWNKNQPHADEAKIGAPNLKPDRTCTLDGKQYGWQTFVTHIHHGAVALERIYGENPYSAVYAYTEFTLPEDAPIQLKIGSNDGYRCWLNGEEVATFDGGRSYAVDEDTVPANGKKGTNRILMKITQHGASWTFGVRVADSEGKPIDLTH